MVQKLNPLFEKNTNPTCNIKRNLIHFKKKRNTVLNPKRKF